MLYMSEKPKRKRCPNGTRKDKTTGDCKKKAEPVKKKKVIKIIKNKPKKEEPIREKKKTIRITDKKKKEKPKAKVKPAPKPALKPEPKLAPKQAPKPAPKPKPKEPENNNLNLDLNKLKVKEMKFYGEFLGYEVNYLDKNLEIQLATDGFNPKIPDLIHLGMFNSQKKLRKPRAPKGFASRALCQILHHLIKIKLIKSRIPFTLTAVNLKGSKGNQKALENFYEKKLGFKPRSKDEPDMMQQSVKEFLSRCEKDGNLLEELKIN